MTTHLIRDEAARLATVAWPIYQALGWHWRGAPVTEARLALEIREGIQALIDDPDRSGYCTGGLNLSWQGEGEDRSIDVEVTVDVGTLRPGGQARLSQWPNTPVVDPWANVQQLTPEHPYVGAEPLPEPSPMPAELRARIRRTPSSTPKASTP